MTARLIFAVATHRKVRSRRQRREQRDEALSRRSAHLLAVLAGETKPPRRCQRLRCDPREKRWTGSEVRNPDVVVVATRELCSRNAARRTTYGSEPQSFVAKTRRAEPDDAY